MPNHSPTPHAPVHGRPDLPQRPRPLLFLRQFAAAWFVLILGLGLTGMGFAWTNDYITSTAKHRFESQAQSIRGELDSYFERLVAALMLLRERAFVGDTPGPEQWAQFMGSVNLNSEFPAVEVSGYAELVWPTDRKEHEQRWTTLQGAPYRIQPELAASERCAELNELASCFLPVVVGVWNSSPTRPIAINDLLGWDLLALRRGSITNEAIAHRIRGSLGRQPRSFAMPTAPGVGTNDVTHWIPIGIPVPWAKPPYKHDERRGVIIAVVNLKRLFAATYATRSPDFGFRLRLAFQDTPVAFPSFDTATLWPHTQELPTPWFQTHLETPLYQSRLLCDFHSTPDFERNNHRRAPWIVAGTGFLLTILTFGLVTVQIRARLKQTVISAGLQASQRALEANRNLLQRVLDNDPAKIYVRDQQGRMLVANKAIADLYRAPVDQIIDAHNRMVASGQYPPGVQQLLQRDMDVMRLGRTEVSEESHTTPDGETLWFLAVRVPIRTSEGQKQVLGISTEITRLKQSEQSLKKIQADLEAALRERARLSRDLHDGTIQGLYALGLEISLARGLILEDPVRANTELARCLISLQSVLTELRQFVLELEPEAWQGQSIHNALEALVVRLRRTTTIQFTLAVSSESEHLPARTAIHVLQIVREGLSNVLRHSEARNVRVELRRVDSLWQLDIQDDGIGFDPELRAQMGGRGLRSLRERAAELQGTCRIESALGNGARIHIEFPTPTLP